MDHTRAAAAVFDKLAKFYQDKFMDVQQYARGLDEFLKYIEPGRERILDIACGPGNISKYLLTKRHSLEILGIDLAPNMIKLAKENNPSAEYQVMDSRELNKLEQHFDGIVCAFLLPYLSTDDCSKLFANIARLSLPGTLLYLSAIEADPSLSGFKKGSTGDEVFMHFYQEPFLRALLEANHFEIIFVDRSFTSTAGGGTDTDLVLVARFLS